MSGFRIFLLVFAALFGGLEAGPAAAENVLRWASATEALTFDPHSANHVPTQVETQPRPHAVAWTPPGPSTASWAWVGWTSCAVSTSFAGAESV